MGPVCHTLVSLIESRMQENGLVCGPQVKGPLIKLGVHLGTFLKLGDTLKWLLDKCPFVDHQAENKKRETFLSWWFTATILQTGTSMGI